MAKRTFDELSDIASFTSLAQGRAAGTGRKWEDVEGAAAVFCAYSPQLYKEAWLWGLVGVETVTYEGMNAKIQKLDPKFSLGIEYRKTYGDATQRAKSAQAFGTVSAMVRSYVDSWSVLY